MPMCEITVESKTRMTEHGRAVLYDKKYRGVLEDSGRFRLLAYFGKRMPLTEAYLMELPSSEEKLIDAA